eukprot:Sspe_Gene.64499::Locus_38213_Transcript_1_1_Confidence_1.000_Length_900::g.64499::m.64499
MYQPNMRRSGRPQAGMDSGRSDLVAQYEAILGPPEEGEALRNLMVNYIPTRATEEDLRMIFMAYGPIEHLRIIRDKNTNEPKGYGFVRYKYSFSAYAATQILNGYQLFHKRLKVSYANQDRVMELMATGELQEKWEFQMPHLQQFYNDYQPQFQQQLAKVINGLWMELAQEGSLPQGLPPLPGLNTDMSGMGFVPMGMDHMMQHQGMMPYMR